MFNSTTKKLPKTLNEESKGIKIFNKKCLEIAKMSGWTEIGKKLLRLMKNREN